MASVITFNILDDIDYITVFQLIDIQDSRSTAPIKMCALVTSVVRVESTLCACVTRISDTDYLDRYVLAP